MNLKLQAIAKLINSQDIVIDVGTDHAYLPIYLKQNKLCKEVYASDVSPKALENAKQNIKKANLKITTYLTNGLKNINNQNINTIVIAGMGTLSILGILEDIPGNITKLIISSNNEHETLRKKLLKKKFYIEKEIVVKENNKYYPIMLLTRNYHKYTKIWFKL